MSDRLPARMRALGTELAALRVRAGLTTRQAATRIGISSASLNRIENAKRSASVADVSAMLAIYGVVGKERKRIMALVEAVTAPGWLETDHQLKELVTALARFEGQATSICHFAPANIPGLLQTPAYAEAIIGDARPDDMRKHLAERLDRQQVLTKRTAPSYVAILDEGALRRPMGGSFVMAQQIHWLIDRAKLPNVEVRVIPFKYGGYSSPGDFLTLSFRDAPTLVYVEHSGASGFLDNPSGSRRLQDKAVKLAKIALDSTDSVNFLTRMAADHERG
ncbi:helix-turn-helix domain-containing protein [Actinokineospora alba]|nr:helix-turn-helix transcriptional regulator [Actinokineospora alba]